MENQIGFFEEDNISSTGQPVIVYYPTRSKSFASSVKDFKVIDSIQVPDESFDEVCKEFLDKKEVRNLNDGMIITEKMYELLGIDLSIDKRKISPLYSYGFDDYSIIGFIVKMTDENFIDLQPQVKEFLYKCEPINARTYRENLYEYHSCSFYTEDANYIFERIQESLDRGELICKIEITLFYGKVWADHIKDDIPIRMIVGNDKVTIKSSTIFLLKKLGYKLEYSCKQFDEPVNTELNNHYSTCYKHFIELSPFAQNFL